MEPSKTHSAALPQQGLTYPAGGCLSELRSGDLMQGGHEGANPHAGQRQANDDAMDSAIAGTSSASEVTANRLEVGTTTDGEGIRGSLRGGMFTRLNAYTVLTDESKKINGRSGRAFDLNKSERTCIIKLGLGDILHSPLSAGQEKNLDSAIALFITKVEKRYNDCKRNTQQFLKKNRLWLSKPLIHDLPQNLILKPNISSEVTITSPVVIGGSTTISAVHAQFTAVDASPAIVNVLPAVVDAPPEIVVEPPIAGCSKDTECVTQNRRTQLRSRKKLEMLIQSEPPAKLIKAFTKVITSQDNERLSYKNARDLETVIHKCLETPTKSTEVLAKINKHTNSYTPEEALGMLIDRKFTAETYKYIQRDLTKRGFCAFPPYHQLAAIKKECYPEDEVQSSEVEASVSLQGLLTHSFKRIILLCDDFINTYCERQHLDELACTFEGSWGFDGSTGQSLYKQKSSRDPSFDENTIFATTFVPLRVMETCSKQIIWINQTPQSYRSCRPLHIQYRKETKDLILAEKEYVEQQIRHLTPIAVATSKGFIVKTVCNLTLSIIDGKVYNIIHSTFSQLRCPICKLTSTNFNDIDLALTKPIDDEALKNGISPLHAFIRFLEFLLHLGYKNDPQVRQWRISKSSAAGKITQDRKKRIQVEIRDRLGLLVDVVRPNSGTTNDGNTARKIFATDESRGTFAEILGVSKWLVDDLHIILVAINCGLPIDCKKFGDFCINVAKKYVAAYNWHPMTTTMHKILVHGQKIIECSTLPVGVLSEQAGESRNKFWRYDREHHSRKDHRKHTMEDLFHRALESSDPVISSTRLSRRLSSIKRMPLPPPVIEMLKPFQFNDDDTGENDDETVACTETDESEFISILTNENDIFTAEN